MHDTGSNVLLGPAGDIARVPLGGRLPEAMGEDPYLTGRLAVAEVRAIEDAAFQRRPSFDAWRVVKGSVAAVESDD